MKQVSAPLAPSAVVVLATLALACTHSFAQDKPCEERVKELEEQLRQTENGRSDLARENESLRRMLADLQNGRDGTVVPLARDAVLADPLASPVALFDALVDDYRAKVGSLPRESKPDLAAYHAAVKEWTRDAADDFRGPVEWEIRIERIDSGVKGNAITFYVLDPTGKPVGESFTKPISERIGREAPRPAEVMTLEGTVSANPRHNSNRAEKSESDSPRFIGAFAEFDFDLEITSLK